MLWFRSKMSNWQRAKTLSTAARQRSNALERQPNCKSNRWKTRLVLLICGLQVFRCAYQLLFFVHVHVIVADWHSAENNWNLRGGKTFSAAGAGSQRAAAAEGARWQEMHGAAAGQCGQRHTTQVGERMCELLPHNRIKWGSLHSRF